MKSRVTFFVLVAVMCLATSWSMETSTLATSLAPGDQEALALIARHWPYLTSSGAWVDFPNACTGETTNFRYITCVSDGTYSYVREFHMSSSFGAENATDTKPPTLTGFGD